MGGGELYDTYSQNSKAEELYLCPDIFTPSIGIISVLFTDVSLL